MEVKIIDNVNERLVDELRTQITKDCKISIAAASFSIYAFEILKNELSSIESFRFIFTSPTFTINDLNEKKQKREFFIPKLRRERNLFGSEYEILLRNKLSQRAIAKECVAWIKEKCEFKTNITQRVINSNYLDIENVDGKYAYIPFNEFTTTELGCEEGDYLTKNVTRLSSPSSQSFIQQFNQIWEDKDVLQDVKDTIIDNIGSLYRENPPEFIYFVTLYNIFNEFLEDISDDTLPNEATGFKESKIWNMLYNFQKDASLAIINKLERYNGCILADSVGLGKTFTALSVIKYYENRNKSVLVLCPKKLNNNWITYKSNYKNNPIYSDRLRYDVLFHTDLSRNRGESNGTDLSLINWGNYDLVVIDESHNFRNGGLVTTSDDGEKRDNRYNILMNKVMKSGVKTKVLMLSATPVNNKFIDLRNQLQLAYEGDSSRFDELLNTTKPVNDIFKHSQRVYNEWSKLKPTERTTERLLQSLSFDFFELLDAVTIARSRKHIEQYYDTTEIGKFPTRLKPISRRPHLTDLKDAINFNDIYKKINSLNLAIYTPSEFILSSCIEKYVDKDDNLTTYGRELGVRRLMGVNLLKRLESSVNSFRLTLERVEDLIVSNIRKIDCYTLNKDDRIEIEDYDTENLDFEDEESFIGSKKTRISLDDMDYISWRQYLCMDVKILKSLLEDLKCITPEHDSKLKQLEFDIVSKCNNTINSNNKKIIIFTAFSDTAQYLYKNLSNKIKNTLGLDVALVTGTGEAKTTKKLNSAVDFNTILTYFSPVSKDKKSLTDVIDGDIDILFATDCISEGQNLQDCDYLINYDIHWNPVRIIQRFGRIDRIGSKNEVIQLVNYWPDMDLDEYIKLKGRVEARMKVSVMTATGDGNPLLTAEEEDDLEYRKKQLERLQEEIVDLEEMNAGVNIMDLGLNEFRLDLLDYIKNHKNIEQTPFGLHAVVQSQDGRKGVIFVLKNRNNGVNIDKKNRLHPFYMVYVSQNGETIIDHLSAKELLDTFRFLCKGKIEIDKNLCADFNKETKDGFKMEKYSTLLSKAIESIIDVKENSDMNSFFDGTQVDLYSSDIKGLNDFELICFLVVR
ncbi:MAG: DEAD/DEAH box helicase family protein [Bacteroidales bacterium]|nr:DEAD/DEAH box helicase family protein [Bacteroidales bacterium]